MAGAADFACALLIAPAVALLAVGAIVLCALLGADEAAGIGILGGLVLFAVIPPVSILLRSRARRLTLDWTCLLLCLTLVSMVATLAALDIAQALVYAHFMASWD